MKITALSLCASLFVISLAHSQSGPLLGEPAPPFSADTCVNAPLILDSEALRGEVILLEFWGIT